MLALLIEREQSAVDLLEAGLRGLGADLTQYSGIQRRVRRLAVGAGPQFLLGHRVGRLGNRLLGQAVRGMDCGRRVH